MWTHFWDMNSGGGKKEKWQHIFIEADQDEAIVIFYNRFGHSPRRVSCTCCGADYSIKSGKELAELTAFHRGCDYDKSGYVERPRRGYEILSVQDYLTDPDVHVIYDADITPIEREGEVPRQGYIWCD